MVWDLLDHREVAAARAPEAFVARRLDDLAYGAGLWWGAVRARSARVLVPRVTGLRRSRGAAAGGLTGDSTCSTTMPLHDGRDGLGDGLLGLALHALEVARGSRR